MIPRELIPNVLVHKIRGSLLGEKKMSDLVQQQMLETMITRNAESARDYLDSCNEELRAAEAKLNEPTLSSAAASCPSPGCSPRRQCEFTARTASAHTGDTRANDEDDDNDNVNNRTKKKEDPSDTIQAARPPLTSIHKVL